MGMLFFPQACLLKSVAIEVKEKEGRYLEKIDILKNLAYRYLVQILDICVEYSKIITFMRKGTIVELYCSNVTTQAYLSFDFYLF